jgi:hypothetical protein
MARLTPPIGPLRDEQGLALPLVLMLLILVSGLALAFLSMSGLEVVVAQNHDSAQRAFHIADAGIEHARAVLPDTDIAGVVAAGGNLFNAVALGSGTYSVNLVENPDGTYFLVSTGLYKDASRSLRALVSAGGLPAPRAAVEILSDGVISEIVAEGSSYDGRDWQAPANIAGCTNIVGCGTLVDPNANPDTYGVSRNKTTGTLKVENENADNGQPGDGGTVYGHDCMVGACGTTFASPAIETDTSLATTRWDAFITAAIERAPSANKINIPPTWTGTYNWGTPSSPAVVVLSRSNTNNLGWQAVVNGTGVLIIDTPGGNIDFGGVGELNWQGVVIIRSPGSVLFKVPSRDQTVRIFGQFVNRSATSAGINLEYTPNAIKSSSAAMGTVRRMFLSVQGWQEVAPQ